MTSTDTMDNTASAEPTRSRRGKGEGLSSMVIPELRKMATELGIKRTSGTVSYTHLTLPTTPYV